jgi:hypothetical protein
MGKYILQVKVEKQNRRNPSKILWACANEATWAHHMLVFFNKTQGLLKNKSELFNVLHAPIYKVISLSIFKIFENLKNCQLYYAHLQIE